MRVPVSIPFYMLIPLYRREHKLSQAQFGAKIGISRNYVSQIERGQIGGVSIDVMEKICKELDLSISIEVKEKEVSTTRSHIDT